MNANLIDRFAERYSFPLDDFQRTAAASLAAQRSVLVCAPTGAGKTVVGEFGVWLALQLNGKAFYTTPLKALSNQKFGDFVARHGAASVGLLTGDNSINGEAPVVVMTTEVLRNMLYERSPTLQGLSVVILDEVHYLRDIYRGATWEEVLIHLPESVQVAALSATVSNADEFGGWLSSVRGETDVVIETERPIPIEHAYMVGTTMHPMFIPKGDRLIANPALTRLSAAQPRDRRQPKGRRGPPPRAKGIRKPDRIQVIEGLVKEDLLPAIVFIFSRAGCAQAVETCAAAGVRLTTTEERERIRAAIELRAHILSDDDLDVLGYDRWVASLEDGIAAHHAGLIPLFKETVEELFEAGLLKVVFATETLSLGINMPARTVVIERLTKWTGERHELMTPADFTQLTGRAGRRGMDEVGYGVTLFQPELGFDRVAQLAETRSYPLVSSFRPSYNMAVNLLRHHSIEESKRLLALSFAQYTADAGVTRQQRQLERNEAAIVGYRENVACHLGDFEEYWSLASRLRRLEKGEAHRLRQSRTAAVRAAFESLRPGDVVHVRRGPRRGIVAIVDVRRGRTGEPQPMGVSPDRRAVRLAIRDFPAPPEVIGSVTIPRGDPRAPSVRHEVARQLEPIPVPERTALQPVEVDDEVKQLGRALGAHACHECPERADHERWMQRIDDLAAQSQQLSARVRTRTGTLARTFEDVLDVLASLGYVDGESLTEKGDQLGRLYTQSDLLLGEAIAADVFEGLSAAALAAVVSSLVFETRIGEPVNALPNEQTRKAFRRLRALAMQLINTERDRNLSLTREPDPGCAHQVFAWASGESLEDVLSAGEMPAGDFVRTVKQVWDLLRQIAAVAPDGTLATAAKDAVHAVYRGVIAASSEL